ncbi:MAG: non-heme iron oxygenase ferredoxin subunit [Acidimicrobiia bacterium]
MTTRVCALDDVAPDSAIRVDVDGHRLAVVRCGDDVYVIGDRCTHQDVSLAEGEVDCDLKTIECWKHGSAFRLESGEPTALPATRPTPTYAVTVVDGDIHVELDA